VFTRSGLTGLLARNLRVGEGLRETSKAVLQCWSDRTEPLPTS
jgi:hypothetical protein